MDADNWENVYVAKRPAPASVRKFYRTEVKVTVYRRDGTDESGTFSLHGDTNVTAQIFRGVSREDAIREAEKMADEPELWNTPKYD